MSSQEKAASGSGFGDESSSRILAVWLQCIAGRESWYLVWISASSGKAAPASGGWAFFVGCHLYVDLYQLCPLPGRHPDGLSGGHDFGNFALGKNLRILAAAYV